MKSSKNPIGRDMKTTFRLKLAVVVLSYLASLLAVGAHAATVTFGQIASVTNPASATNAKGMTLGIQVHFASVNAKGGINGHKLALKTLDDGLKAPQMVTLTQELIADPSIVGLLGFLNSTGLAEITKQDLPKDGRIALIAPLQGDKHIVSSPNVFPLRSAYADEIRALLAEAKTWGKNDIAVVNMSVAFGPGFADLTTAMAKDMGMKVTVRAVIDATSPETIAASAKAATAEIEKLAPKAIIVLAAGKPATAFLDNVQSSKAFGTQIYGLSVMIHTQVVEAIGKEKARGIIISQATPYPYTASKPIITEYQAAMKKYAPNEALSFSSLEGFMGAKIAAEAVRRSGASPTRDKILVALNGLGEYDLGGIFVSYQAQQKRGWGGVELTIVDANGRLRK
jgi:branched-chain amino acid transport system substrate-binding protein